MSIVLSFLKLKLLRNEVIFLQSNSIFVYLYRCSGQRFSIGIYLSFYFMIIYGVYFLVHRGASAQFRLLHRPTVGGELSHF